MAIARAFIHRPKVVFADEPTGRLNERQTAEWMQIMLDFCKKYETTLVMATNDVDLLNYADKKYLIRDGELTVQE